MAETLISPGISLSEVDQSAIPPRPLVAGAAILGPTVKGRINVPTKVTSYADYQREFGDVFRTTSGSVEITQEFLTSIAARNYFEQGGESLLVTRVGDSTAFGPATSTTVQATGSAPTGTVPFALETLSPGVMMNNTAGTVWQSSDVRADGSMISGSSDNIRWQISSVNPDNGTFNLIIRRGDDTTKEQIVLESFGNLSLDPTSPNFISKIIGDQKEVFDGISSVQVEAGSYPNKSRYVRVSSVNPILDYLDTAGNPRLITPAQEASGDDPAVPAVYASDLLPAVQEGGFTGGRGIVGACYKATDHTEDPGKAVYFENLQKTEGSYYNQSVLAANYAGAIDLMANTDEYQINILSAPGLLDTTMINRLVSVAENRTDCIAVVDLETFNTTVENVAANSSAVNSSYAAEYWPWLQMISATGRYVWCPASTVIPGVYTYTDHQAAPWFAPAGMTRGGVQGVIQTAKKLTKADRDILYNKNVNPIATMPGAGIVIYGQKTLQKKASALDRINVRRLLIEVKDTIRRMAAGLLFEQNTTALQNQFKAQVDPYLASVVQRKGLVAYSIDLSGNTPDAIDRNEFHCGIRLQPTKTIEFIYLTFTVTASGVSFD